MIFKDIIHSHYITYMTPTPLVMDFTILVDPYIGHYYYIRSLSHQSPGVEKIIFRNTSILHFLTQNHLPLGWGV